MTTLALDSHNLAMMPVAARLQDRSEADLAAAVRESRDGSCFEELYRRQRRRIFGLCLHYLKQPDAAEEAVHDAFVRAWEHAHTQRGENFGAWIGRIATNVCLNRLRARRPTEAVSEERTEGASPVPPEQRAIQQERADTAREILLEMEAGQRRALLLKYLDGCTYEEIGGLTGESYDQVRSHLQNGRRNFRNRWERRLQKTGGQNHG